MRTHRLTAHALLCGALTLAALPAAAQETFSACYVPGVGALYLTGQSGLPQDCLSGAHIEITWSASGAIEDEAIVTAKLADGAVTTVKLQDLAVTLDKLAFDPTTQAELDAFAQALRAAGAVNHPANPIDWTQLKGVPAGFADGQDDTGTGTATDLACNGCVGSGDIADGSITATDLAFVPGDITAVNAGDGLAGGGASGALTVSVAFEGPGSAQTVARSDHTHSRPGSGNVAIGGGALDSNESGIQNTAIGSNALTNNVTANANVAIGAGAMDGSTGAQNTGIGAFALRPVSSDNNTAVGYRAASITATGASNTAFGSRALRNNTSGGSNTAVGHNALAAAGGGHSNTGLGFSTLSTLTSGDNNIAVGALAGESLGSGSNNIYIGHAGANESNVIRIGNGQGSAFMAGVFGRTAAGGISVLVSPDGKLGTSSSSARFKEDIEAIEADDALLRLRPVRFLYRPEFDDGSRTPQYGLIAEEVAQLYPELVVTGEDGRVDTVRYHFLPILLLAEVQRQAAENQELRQRLERLEALIEAAGM